MKTLRYLLFTLLLLFTAILGIRADESSFAPGAITITPLVVSRTSTFSHFQNGVGIRLAYDLTDRLGFNLDVDGHDIHGTLIENGSASIRLGVPIGKLKIYGTGGIDDRFPQSDIGFHFGLGAEYAITKNVRALVEATGVKRLHEPPLTAEFRAGVGVSF